MHVYIVKQSRHNPHINTRVFQCLCLRTLCHTLDMVYNHTRYDIMFTQKRQQSARERRDKESDAKLSTYAPTLDNCMQNMCNAHQLWLFAWYKWSLVADNFSIPLLLLLHSKLILSHNSFNVFITMQSLHKLGIFYTSKRWEKTPFYHRDTFFFFYKPDHTHKQTYL